MQGLLDWFSTPWGIAVTSTVTLVGLPLALYGIVRTVSATSAARRGAEYATLVLRTADFRESVKITRDMAVKIISLQQRRSGSASQMAALGQAWMDGHYRVFGLVLNYAAIPQRLVFERAMKGATAEVQVALEAANDTERWSRYRMPILRKKLNTYSETAEALLRAADDEVIRSA